MASVIEFNFFFFFPVPSWKLISWIRVRRVGGWEEETCSTCEFNFSVQEDRITFICDTKIRLTKWIRAQQKKFCSKNQHQRKNFFLSRMFTNVAQLQHMKKSFFSFRCWRSLEINIHISIPLSPSHATASFVLIRMTKYIPLLITTQQPIERGWIMKTGSRRWVYVRLMEACGERRFE